MPAEEDGSEPMFNYGGVRKVSDTQFVFEHKTDAEKNIRVELRIADGNNFEWIGLPGAVEVAIRQFNPNF